MAERVLSDGVVENNNFEEIREESKKKQMAVAILLNQLRVGLADQSAYRNLQDAIIATIENRKYIYDSDIELRIEKIICEAVKRCKQDTTSKKLLEEIFNSKEEIDNISVKEFIEGVVSFLKEKDKS